MNHTQVLNYLIREGAQHFDQLLDWANRKEFDQEQTDFLLHMPFSVEKCDRCGEPIYTGDELGWWYMTGTHPKQDTAVHVEVRTDDVIDLRWTLCSYCYTKLTQFTR